MYRLNGKEIPPAVLGGKGTTPEVRVVVRVVRGSVSAQKANEINVRYQGRMRRGNVWMNRVTSQQIVS